MALRPQSRLRFVNPDEPGIRRTGSVRFRYRDERTREWVRDPQELERIRSIAVPPAWTDVWICADPEGHIQASGRDARGRKQYRYHLGFRAEREKAKFDELLDFGRALNDLRTRVDVDLGRKGLPQERIVALVVALLDRTLVRVGNEEYVADNGTYGLTTLRRRHAQVVEGTIRLTFPGKGGRRHDVVCTDQRLCRLVRRCQDLRGQVLFEYRDDGSEVRPVASDEVNEYLRAATGLDVTAKTFRTWGATRLAAAALAAMAPPETVRDRQAGEKWVFEQVAAELRNSPAVCRASYIHPVVVEQYGAGTLPRLWAAGPSRSKGQLTADERRLLRLLGKPQRRRRTTTAAAA